MGVCCKNEQYNQSHMKDTWDTREARTKPEKHESHSKTQTTLEEHEPHSKKTNHLPIAKNQ